MIFDRETGKFARFEIEAPFDVEYLPVHSGNETTPKLIEKRTIDVSARQLKI